MSVFSGKGHAVWRQPLKVTFMGEAGMDSGGVTREWFCALSSAISRNSPDLFWNVVSSPGLSNREGQRKRRGGGGVERAWPVTPDIRGY